MDAHRLEILLIEDNPGDALLVEEYLAAAGPPGFEVVIAGRLSAGLERLERGPVDAVLLDLSLPDSVGLDGLDQIIVRFPTVPVVILTGRKEEFLGLEAVRRGAEDYLVKGELSSALLARTLRYAQERRRASEQVRQKEAFLRLLTEQLPAILWTTDSVLRFTSSVGAGLAGLNLERDQIVGLPLFKHLALADPTSPTLLAHQQALRGVPAVYDFEWQGRTYQSHVEPLRQSNQQIVGTIGVALDITDHKRVEEEFRLARKIQQGLLPRSAPPLACCDLAGASFPAEATGGDYFDFIPIGEAGLGIALGDVSGHGFGPALLMASIRAYLRALARSHGAIGDILQLANRLLCEDINEDQFVTLFLARFDPRTGILVYANAGHPTGYVLDAHGTLKERLRSTCLPLGVMPEGDFAEERAIELVPGDTLVLITDGILESSSADETPFGESRVLDIVRIYQQESAQSIILNLYHAVRAFAHHTPQLDDISAVVLKVGSIP